jgi:hypothetical protein
MGVNYFVAATAVLWLLGAAQYAHAHNWRMVTVSVCYALATFALVGAE